MTARIKVSAPGKIILSGEHAVVYGFPAILAAVNRRLSIEIGKNNNHVVFPSEGEDLLKFSLAKIKEIAKIEFSNTLRATIYSEIPIGCGMGSSAAFAVALTTAVLRYCEVPWDLEKINKIAYEIEKKQHGNPSGGDNTVSTYGGFLLYRKETEICKVFSPLKIAIFPSFFLINTGKPVETTGEMVSKVKEFCLRFPAKGERIFRDIEQTTRGFLKFLSGEKSSLEELIRTNERLLEELGVVSRNTRNLIRKVEKIGGSAKISGAGGLRENSGVVLAYHQDPEALLKFAGEENLDIFEVKLGERGVRSEKFF